MSFLVKHSSAPVDEEMTTTSRDPKRREKMGPRSEGFGEVVEGPVEEVEVADDWKGRRTWRDVGAAVVYFL
ncbi:hypothetical protein RHMOL_Rhmol10G0140800 [Rhododendron molle]|uniref:Uncharacterized protein n=1 Tax=Rhododendron molle TaxID=49168 RepID=A0ACC0M2A3_RHOML|nr:hypothetical protein RHMOL_Rhmol10G0140800 [Rhododendron molle]